MDDALIEEIAAHMHDAWTDEHPGVVPDYANSSEIAHERDRVTARLALKGIERAGYRLVKDAGVRTYPTT